MARSYGKTYLSIWGDGDFRALHPDAQRMDEARRSLKAAMVTISHAQTAALAVAATPYRVEAVNHAAEHAMAAIRGMDKALRADWMDPRGGTYDGNL